MTLQLLSRRGRLYIRGAHNFTSAQETGDYFSTSYSPDGIAVDVGLRVTEFLDM
jgi:hypothetical protein